MSLNSPAPLRAVIHDTFGKWESDLETRKEKKS